jgi:hypothetical protein
MRFRKYQTGVIGEQAVIDVAERLQLRGLVLTRCAAIPLCNVANGSKRGFEKRMIDVRLSLNSRPWSGQRLGLLRADTVEKVFWGWRTKFSRAADAFRGQRCEGPLRFSEKRPRTFPLALCSIPAADLSKNQHLRDFWSFSIFDFFNSIDPDQTSVR